MEAAIEARIDAMFAGDPAAFTQTRDRLVKELRAAGDRASADLVALLRRPGKLAAALNRLAREDAAAVTAALRADDDLASVQARVLAGEADGDELRLAASRATESVTALSADAAVRSAFRLAARSVDARDDLLAGRLTRDPEPDPAAGLFGGGQVTQPRPRARAAAAAPDPPSPPPEDELALARERRRTAESERRAAQRERELAEALERLRSAEEDVSAARQGREAASHRRGGLRAARESALARTEEARRVLDDLQSELTALDAELTAADHGVAASEAAVASAEARLADVTRDAASVLEPPQD